MQHHYENIAVVILAAGLGTRMKSDKAKVLHEVCGRPMILYVVETAAKVAGEHIILVVGHQAGKVRDVVTKCAKVRYTLQEQQLGTGHAVASALPDVPVECRHVVILCGDVPLVTERTIRNLIADHCTHQRDITVLAMEVEAPTGYGRIVFDDAGRVVAIVEETDASEEQRKIRIVNTGIYCIAKPFLAHAIKQIDRNNAQGELYLTDIVAVCHRDNGNVGAMIAENAQEFRGINTRDDLADVEGLMRRLNLIKP
jgi:UDP-N-acetylglucosamine diphosphorylase/glucosamine-1-phosphate N-acetyltransferase